MDEETIFHQAREKPSGERAAFLDQVCGDGLTLRRRVEALLQAYDHPDRLFESEALAFTISEPTVAEDPGTVIGPYKLLQKLGEGGMGAVYAAEQQEPVKRLVALKIIKLGMDSGQVLRRFEAERQALALMDHPNIARVFDAGTTNAGRPYFVMELVKGFPITEYCDRELLSPQGRLDLFIDVCHAVQHAHQKGVIHRDLKPSNILVAMYDGKPVVKVIDFGLAKAIDQKLTERTLFTEVGQILGTLEYMSPEQAELNNLDVDTRADVYSLGVVLYELLAGSPPFTAQQLRGAAFLEMLRLIREVDPPKPSTRLSSSEQLPILAANRKLEPKQLTRVVQGDLDWIVMKCLNKDRVRRYETASELAMDIQRYLGDEPVLAGAPSAAYRLRKFIKRNRRPVYAATAVVLALVGGVTGTTWGLFEARNGRNAAERANIELTRERDNAVQARAEEAKQTQIAIAAEAAARKFAQLEKVARNQAEVEKRAAEFEAFRAQCANHANRMDLASRAWQQHDVYRAEQILRDVGGPFQQTWETRHLRDLLRRTARPLRHDWRVAPALSADGERIVSSDALHAKVWNASTGNDLMTFEAGAVTTLKGNMRIHPVRCVAISGDGRTIITGSGNYEQREELAELRVWNVTTGQLRKSLRGHVGDVHRVAISADGKRIVSVGGGTLKAWNVERGSEVFTLNGNYGNYGSLALSADGRHLSAAGGERALGVRDQIPGSTERAALAATDVQIVNAETGQIERILKGHKLPVLSLAMSADGKRLVSADGSEAKVWDAETGRERLSLKSQSDSSEFQSVALSGDGKTLVSFVASNLSNPPPGEVTVYDATTGQKKLSLKGHAGPVSNVAVSGDGQRIVSASDDVLEPLARVWNLAAAHETRTLKGHTAAVLSVAVNADAKRVLSGSEDQTVRVWDTGNGHEQQVLKGHTSEVRSVVFSANGRQVTSAGGPLQGNIIGEVKIWDSATGAIKRAFNTGLPVFGVAMSTDARSIAVGGGTRGAGELPSFGELGVWDGITGQPKITLGTSERDARTGREIHLTPAINAIAMSGDGQLVVSAGVDGTLKMWDVESGRERLSLEKYPQGVVKSVAVSADGLQVVSGGSDQTAKIWDSRGLEKFILHGHTDDVESVALSSDGRRVITASADKTVKLWDARTGQEMFTLTGHSGTVTSVAISHNGQSIVSGSADGTIKVWDAPTTDELLFLNGHTTPITSVAISADGRHVVSGSGSIGTHEPGEIRLWDGRTGRESFALKSVANAVTAVAISADGKWIASVSRDGSVTACDMGIGREILAVKGSYGSVAISADGQSIAAGTTDVDKPNSITVWDASTGKVKLSLAGQTGMVDYVAISDDGRRVVARGTRIKPDESVIEELKVWDSVPIKECFSRQGQFGNLATSADGERIVSVTHGSHVIVLDAGTGRELSRLNPHLGSADCVAISTHGQRIVLGGPDGRVKIWDPQQGSTAVTLRGMSAGITCVAISADGKQIVSGSSDRLVTLWQGP